MASILKKAVSGLLDQLLKPAQVIAVRTWQSATMYELDLNLSAGNIENWTTIRRLKCRVGYLEYRDYTPALWNAETQTCTMFIGSGHDGAGARWVSQLKEGDEILVGDSHAAQLPAKEGSVLALGDGSALGHLMALKQLTDRDRYPLDAAIYLQDNFMLPSPLLDHNQEFSFITEPGMNGFEALSQWCNSKDLYKYASVYIAGNILMVRKLRELLKTATNPQVKIFPHGFWQ